MEAALAAPVHQSIDALRAFWPSWTFGRRDGKLVQVHDEHSTGAGILIAIEKAKARARMLLRAAREHATGAAHGASSVARNRSMGGGRGA